MNRELLGRSGHLVVSGPATYGWPLKVPCTVVGFGRGRVKVRVRKPDGGSVEAFVKEDRLHVRTHYGRRSRTQRCKHKGCPAFFVNEFALERHEALSHVKCSCGRMFTEVGRTRHLAQCKRREIKHPPLEQS